MKKTPKISFVLLVIISVYLSSCATIFRGSMQKISFNSEPPGAEIFVNGISTGKVTPDIVNVKRKNRAGTYRNNIKHQVFYDLKKEGYFDYVTQDLGKFDMGSYIAFYVNFYTLGIGHIIDATSGAFWVYTPYVFGQLYPKKETNQSSAQSDNTLLTNSPNDNFDVDKNIPANPAKNPYRFALIIGNEDYSSFQKDLNSEVNVAYAINDASIFKEYTSKTLGVPEENITLLVNAKAMDMNRAIKKINLLSKNSGGKAEIIFYYAGHGFPDEQTKEPYLMPVDVSGSELDFAVKLSDLYKQLNEFPCQKVTVFLDACFSGGARNQGLLAARGVKIKPKEGELKGKMVVFSASSGDQSSLPYKEKKHGLFTYFLLKKFQESMGVLTYKTLSDYLSEQIGVKSIIINNKEQNPQTNVSAEAQDVWAIWSFK